MDVELLAIDLSTCGRCTGTEDAVAAAVRDLGPALAEVGVELRFRRTVVESAAQATQLRFRSSPTIRIDGRDLPVELRESRCGDCATLCGGASAIDCREWVWRGKGYTAAPKGLVIDAILNAYVRPPVTSPQPNEEFVLPENLRTFFAARQTVVRNTDAKGKPARWRDSGCCRSSQEAKRTDGTE
jgi:hypothetical protein